MTKPGKLSAQRTHDSSLSQPVSIRWQSMRWFDDVTNSMDMSMSKLWEMVKEREAWHAVVHWVSKSKTQLSDKANKTWISIKCYFEPPDSQDEKEPCQGTYFFNAWNVKAHLICQGVWISRFALFGGCLPQPKQRPDKEMIPWWWEGKPSALNKTLWPWQYPFSH